MPTVAGIPVAFRSGQSLPWGTAPPAAQVGTTRPAPPPPPVPTYVAGGQPAGSKNPVDWIDAGSPDTIDGAVQSSLMRGTGGALAFWQRRQIQGPDVHPQGAPFWLQSRPYSRGAAAYAPKFGIIPTNPIGAGIYAPYRMPTIAGPGARYQFGAIFFDVQAIPTTMRQAPTVPVDSINALLAQSHVAAMYATTG